ncbi:MAG: SPASM domain-containing protein, partial [Myxococcota bacterium]
LAARGARVTLVTDGADLDAGRAWALLHAGLDTLRLDVPARPDVARAVRNVEKLVAMRDANRKPGPAVEVWLRFDPIAPAGLVEALAACERLDVAPHVALGPGPAHPDAAGVVARARDVARQARRHATVRVLDDVARRLRGEGAPCRVPWYEAHVGADGAVHPCAPRVGRAPGVGTARHAPFAEAWAGPAMRAFRALLGARREADPLCHACPHDDAGLFPRFFPRADGRFPSGGSVASGARFVSKWGSFPG